MIVYRYHIKLLMFLGLFTDNAWAQHYWSSFGAFPHISGCHDGIFETPPITGFLSLDFPKNLATFVHGLSLVELQKKCYGPINKWVMLVSTLQGKTLA
jgi:hypothetical protein